MKNDHNAYQREWSKKRYWYRKEHRLCTYCGKPLLPNEINVCDDDRKKESDRRRNTYHYYQSNGICPVCHEVTLLPGEYICAICKRFRNSRESNERKKQLDRASHMRMRTRRKAAGLCSICGTEAADPGYATCSICREHKKWLKRRRTEKYRNSAKCTTCGKPIMTGKYATCLDCRRKDAIRKGLKVIPNA